MYVQDDRTDKGLEVGLVSQEVLHEVVAGAHPLVLLHLLPAGAANLTGKMKKPRCAARSYRRLACSCRRTKNRRAACNYEGSESSTSRRPHPAAPMKPASAPS